MKRDMFSILCCPVCKGDLELKIDKMENEDVIEGSLSCSVCKKRYRIEEGIPRMLPELAQNIN